MNSIDVEAVDSISSDEHERVDETSDLGTVTAPEYVFYGGKGGVGKTTCAAATALASANEGTATLVVSTDPAHSLSDILGVSIPNEPTRISENHPLFGAEIDSEAADSVFDQGPEMSGMDDLFGGADPMGMGMDADPEMDIDIEMGFGPTDPSGMAGSDEAAAFQLLLEYMDDPRFDRVVIDTAPTGHTLRLLALPERVDGMMDRFLSLRDQVRGTLGNMPGPFGDPAAEEFDGLEETADRIERLRKALSDPTRTEFRIVMVPERLSVIESERLLGRLEEVGIPTGMVVVNRVTEDLGKITDMDADYVTPNPESCEFCAKRWESQQSALQRAQELFQSREIRRVPLFATEVDDPEMLRVVAACLSA